MKIKVTPVQRFDDSYEKETSAAIAAIAYVVFVYFVAQTQISAVLPVVHLIFSIIACSWVYKISDRQNRPPGWLAFYALLLPVPMLIIMGLSRKRNISFEINPSSEEQQFESLKIYANSFLSKGKNKEAAFIYKYLIGTYDHDQEDVEKYEDLQGMCIGKIPDVLGWESESIDVNPKPIPESVQPEAQPTYSINRQEAGSKEDVFNVAALILLMMCVFIHLVLALNRPHKDRYGPDDKLYYFGEDNYSDYYIYPWWTLNFIYLIYVVCGALYYFGYLRLPKRKPKRI